MTNSQPEINMDAVAIARQIARVRKETHDQARASQAARRSVELDQTGGQNYYLNGERVATVGVDNDGNFVTIRNAGVSPPPPRPTPPFASSRVGGVEIEWDGLFMDGVWSEAITQIEIHATVADVPSLSDATQIGTLPSRQGGTMFYSIGEAAGEMYYWLVAVNVAGVESSPSDSTPAQAIDPATSEDWQQHEDALDQLINVSLPALQADITDNETAIEQLNTITLPGLESELASRVRIIFATAQPAGLSADDRVIWYDEDNGYAASYWDGDSWGPYELGSGAIAANAIIASKIAADAVTAVKIAADAVTAVKIAADAVTAVKIAADAVTANKIAAEAVTTAKLAANAVTTYTLAAGAVTAEQLDVEVLRAGFTLTGRIQVGQAYWTPTEGLIIPQPNGGRIHLPADGVTPANFDGHATLASATIRNNLNVLGAANKISGSVTLSAGITEPTAPPAVFQSWASIQSDHLPGTSTAWRIFTGMCPHHSNTNIFMTLVNYGGIAIRGISRVSGSVAILPDITNGKTWVENTFGFGVGYASGHYYVYLADHNRGGQFYIYKINTSGDKVSEVLVNSDPYAHDGRNPVITADAGTGRVLLAYRFVDSIRLVQYDLNLGLLGVNDVAGFTGTSNLSGVYLGAADTGTVRIWIAVEETRQVYVYQHSNLAYQNTYNFPYADNSLMRGLSYDSVAARFTSFDRDGKIHTYTAFQQAQTVTASYTWYDGYPTERETREGPSFTFALPARARLNVETGVPPDSGNTDPLQVDKANRAGVYVGIGANPRRRQAYLNVDENGVSIRLLTMDTIATGTATTPASNTFVGGMTSTGKIISASTGVGGQPELEISGDGTAKVKTLNGMAVIDSGWVDLPNTVAAGNLQYRVKMGWVHVRFISVAATASGTTYTVSTAQIPAAYRPSKSARGACDFSGFPGSMLVLTSGNVQVAHNSGANRATIEGAVSYPVEGN